MQILEDMLNGFFKLMLYVFIVCWALSILWGIALILQLLLTPDYYNFQWWHLINWVSGIALISIYLGRE